MAVEVFTNNATTTVSSGGTGAPVSGTTETWTVASSASFPASGIASLQPFHVADPLPPAEKILVPAVNGTTGRVARGDGGTPPVPPLSGFTIVAAARGGFLNNVQAVVAPAGD